MKYIVQYHISQTQMAELLFIAIFFTCVPAGQRAQGLSVELTTSRATQVATLTTEHRVTQMPQNEVAWAKQWS